MVRFEEKKLVIEIEDSWPVDRWRRMVRDLLYAIGAFNKELADNNDDCIYTMSDLLIEMLPDELVLRKMLEERGLKP